MARELTPEERALMLTRMVTMIRVVFLSRDDDRYWMVVLVPGAHDNPGGVRLNLGSGSDGSFASAEEAREMADEVGVLLVEDL
jgi:hypothetical protein